jgi:hypothetical protein
MVAQMIGGIVRDEREIVNDKYMMEGLRCDARARPSTPTEEVGIMICVTEAQAFGFKGGHDVSYRGAERRGDGERGWRPISIMRPPQMGQRSMRWPVRTA